MKNNVIANTIKASINLKTINTLINLLSLELDKLKTNEFINILSK